MKLAYSEVNPKLSLLTLDELALFTENLHVFKVRRRAPWKETESIRYGPSLKGSVWALSFNTIMKVNCLE